LPATGLAPTPRIVSSRTYCQAQALRLPTFDKPRVISRAELHSHHIALPRGCVDEVREAFTTHGVQIDVNDERCSGEPLVAQFMGTLRPEQQRAVEALLEHDYGVLAATTAFGKTRAGFAIIDDNFGIRTSRNRVLSAVCALQISPCARPRISKRCRCILDNRSPRCAPS
jgi:hypothetical protein